MKPLNIINEYVFKGLVLRGQSMIAIRNLTKPCESWKGTLHIASRGEWKLDEEPPDKSRQYYSTTQKKLYRGEYLQPSEIRHEHIVSPYF